VCDAKAYAKPRCAAVCADEAVEPSSVTGGSATSVGTARTLAIGSSGGSGRTPPKDSSSSSWRS
jgi:hypothetical protein